MPWSPRALRLFQCLEKYGIPLLDDREGENTGHLVDVDAQGARIVGIMADLASGEPSKETLDLLVDLQTLVRRGRQGDNVYEGSR